jgi:hypothetical protein
MDVVKYISRYIPAWIYKGKTQYVFTLFINHAHYDIRICYQTNDGNKFLFLYENIDDENQLLTSLKLMRNQLKKSGFLDGDYATKEGYTIKKYNEWSNQN